MRIASFLVAGLLGAAVTWWFLRTPGPSVPQPAPVQETRPEPTAEQAATVDPNLVVDPAAFRRARATVGVGEAVMGGSERITPEPKPEPGLAEERARLFQALKEKEDPKLAELVEVLAGHRLNTAAIAASAWVLADNWGIFALGESDARKRIDDPALFEKLAQTRREILIENPEAELAHVVGGAVPAEVLRKIEEIGRKYPPSEKERQKRSGEPRRSRVRLPDGEPE